VSATRIEVLKHEIATLRLDKNHESTQRGKHTMGKLFVTEFVTADGVAQAPSGPDEDRSGDFAYGDCQAPYGDAAVENLVFAQASTMDALLLGCRTSQIFAGRRHLEHRPDQGE
jgi:hypothetical protein